jgi:DNA-binding MarR family transcriptional regulator
MYYDQQLWELATALYVSLEKVLGAHIADRMTQLRSAGESYKKMILEPALYNELAEKWKNCQKAISSKRTSKKKVEAAKTDFISALQKCVAAHSKEHPDAVSTSLKQSVPTGEPSNPDLLKVIGEFGISDQFILSRRVGIDQARVSDFLKSLSDEGFVVKIKSRHPLPSVRNSQKGKRPWVEIVKLTQAGREYCRKHFGEDSMGAAGWDIEEEKHIHHYLINMVSVLPYVSDVEYRDFGPGKRKGQIHSQSGGGWSIIPDIHARWRHERSRNTGVVPIEVVNIYDPTYTLEKVKKLVDSEVNQAVFVFRHRKDIAILKADIDKNLSSFASGYATETTLELYELTREELPGTNTSKIIARYHGTIVVPRANRKDRL